MTQPDLLSVRKTAGVIAIIVTIGLVANRAATEQLAAGRPLRLQESTVGIWQYLREGLTVLLVLALMNGVIRHKFRLTGAARVDPWVMLFGCFLALQVLRVLTSPSLPATYAPLGLRFAYMALIFSAVRHYAPSQREELVNLLVRWTKPFFLLLMILTFLQVFTALPTFGTTAFGSRPWGVYASPNNLGLALLGFMVLVAISRDRHRMQLMMLIAPACLFTGSRLAILGYLLVAGGLMVSKWHRRLAIVPAAALSLIALYIGASSEALSGREIGGEARFTVWADAWQALDGPYTKLFGLGLGVGSNASIVGFGRSSAIPVAASDSTVAAMILSLGLLGVLALAGAYLVLFRKIVFERRFVLIPVLTLAGLSFVIPEVSPFNVLMAVALASSTRRCACRRVTKAQAVGNA